MIGGCPTFVTVDGLANLANLGFMPKIVNMHEAKTTLSQLVSEVEKGAEVVLARDGKPVAKLVPIPNLPQRKLGQWKGKVRMSVDFDAPLPEDLLVAFGTKP